MRRFLFALLGSLFVFPYAFAVFNAHFQFALPADFFQLAFRTFLQATFSSLFGILIGGIGAAGLLRRSPKWEALAIFPSVVPSIAVVLSFMTVLPVLRGWFAVALAHGLISAGIIAVTLSRTIRSSLGASLELAWCEGATRSAIWIRGVLPAVREDLVRVAVAVFAMSLTSFSIPLLLGGSQVASFEIAILQAIRLDNAWSVAASLSFFQMLSLLVLIFNLAKGNRVSVRAHESVTRIEIGRVLGSNLAFASLFISPLVILFSLFRSPLTALKQIETAGLFLGKETFVLAFQGSVVTATLAGIFSALILTGFIFVFPSEKFRRLISGYAAPSVAITGFATLMLGWRTDPSFAWDSLRIAIGSACLFAPVIWRLRFETALARLEGQMRVAATLGAPFPMTFKKVLFPQMQEILFWSAGLVSFWVWGDYAIGSVAASRSMTIALIAKGLLETYRLEAASILILVCLICGAVSYRLFLLGGTRVPR